MRVEVFGIPSLAHRHMKHPRTMLEKKQYNTLILSASSSSSSGTGRVDRMTWGPNAPRSSREHISFWKKRVYGYWSAFIVECRDTYTEG